MIDLASYIWDILSTIIDKISEGINFLKSLITSIPTFLSIFPSEISGILIAVVILAIIIFIFKFLT